MEKHPLHLKNPELQTSPEVNRAVKRQERRTGEYVPNDPTERIEAYTDRLENIFLHPDSKTKERNLDIFREKIYDELIIKRENFPESYFELQQRIARERGQPVENIPTNVREQMIDTAIADQKASLDAWIDYLTSPDAVYPAWFKHYAWKNIIKLSQFDKERGEFKKRTDSTVAPFPDIYREPLAQIADLYEKVKADNKNLREEEIKEQFSKKFPSLYADLISKSLAASMEGREEIRGQWIKYEHGKEGDAKKLFSSLEGKGTGWCTAGHSTAESQINSGDFYVYYTYDQGGNPTQPRLAIRMEGDQKIGEVRGILPHQGVEPLMQETLDEKLKDFGSEADSYRKKSEDMRILTALERRYENDEEFNREDLLFLYEINAPIESFGYQKDPRINYLTAGRNTEEDMEVIFNCNRVEIARVPNEINVNTKAYVGPLEPGVLQKLHGNMEYVYTSFPDGRIRTDSIEIGGKDCEQLIHELKTAGINISPDTKSMLRSRDFVSGKKKEKINLIRLTVADLGFSRYSNRAATDQLYARAQELGLELCPPDTGPNYRLKYRDQPMDEVLNIGMKPLTVASGIQKIFNLEHDHHSLVLSYTSETDSHYMWSSMDKFLFRIETV